MSLEQHIGRQDMTLEIGTLPFQSGIFVIADVVPGPAVEAAVLKSRHEIRNQVGTEMVALVDDAPDVVRRGLQRQARAISQSGGEVAHRLPLRVEHAHRRARDELQSLLSRWEEAFERR